MIGQTIRRWGYIGFCRSIATDAECMDRPIEDIVRAKLILFSFASCTQAEGGGIITPANKISFRFVFVNISILWGLWPRMDFSRMATQVISPSTPKALLTAAAVGLAALLFFLGPLLLKGHLARLVPLSHAYNLRQTGLYTVESVRGIRLSAAAIKAGTLTVVSTPDARALKKIAVR